MTIFLGLVVGIIIFVIWGINAEKKEKQQNGTNKIPNESEVRMAVLFIETAAKFVKEHQSVLESNQITMWQHGNVGEGFIIEFYGYDRFVRSIIENWLDGIIGNWKIYEDIEDDVLRIRNTYQSSYMGSWNNFNKTVWDEIKRKHPEWKIEKPFSHKCVLYV